MRITPFDPGLEKTTLYLGECPLPTRHGQFAVHFFRDLTLDRNAMAISIGDFLGTEPNLVRVHSSCLTSECLAGRDCDCAEQLDRALAMMSREGQGVLFYLMQEGRGAGLTAKARDRMIVQASGNRKTTFEAYAEMGLPPDLRRYEVLAPMSRLLGLRSSIRLLTNNPEKASAVSKVFSEVGIEVIRREKIQGATSSFNRDYLAAKHDSGHAFARPTGAVGAMPPSSVRVIPPFVLPGQSHRVVTASYFLPIRLSLADPTTETEAASAFVEKTEWFRLSVIFDGKRAQESIFLSHRETPLEDVLAELGELDSLEANDGTIVMSMLDRLPREAAPGRIALAESLGKIDRAGEGSVGVQFDDRAGFLLNSPKSSKENQDSKSGRAEGGRSSQSVGSRVDS